MDYFLLPTVKSETFSGIICKLLTSEEEAQVKRLLMSLLDVHQREVKWFEQKVNPQVRASTMKHLLALFESRIHKPQAERRLDVAIPLVVDNSTLPSEILEGLAFARKLVMENPLPPQASGAEDGVIRVQLAGAIVTLLKKLTHFELCDARIAREKTEAVRGLLGCLLAAPFVEGSLEIIQSLKVICANDNGKEVIDFVCKQYEGEVLHYNNVNNFGLRGRELKNVILLTKWNDAAKLFCEKKDVSIPRGDWISFVEWLGYILNSEHICATKTIGESHLFAENSEGDYVMLFITDAQEDTLSVSIRGTSRLICDHVIKSISLLQDKLRNYSLP